MKLETRQLELTEYIKIKPRLRLKFTKSVPYSLKRIFQYLILDTLPYFPEFKNKIKMILVGYTVSGVAFYNQYESEKDKIYIKLSAEATKKSVAHELTHHIQFFYSHFKDEAMKYSYLRLLYMKKIPHGEKACDIYTFARHVDLANGRSSYFGEIKLDSKKLHEISREAIKKRNIEGYRQYIRWFEEKLHAHHSRGSPHTRKNEEGCGSGKRKI